ncbi:MAG: ATP synthase subunit I [Cellvibrionaceae bacterium]
MNKGKTIGRLITVLWGRQLTFLLLVVGILWWFDPVLAYSALIGGLIFWLPNAYFTLYAFRFRGAQAAAAVLRSMYRGEIGKFVLTIVGFSIVFSVVKPLEPISLFLTYIVMTVTHWILVSRWP